MGELCPTTKLVEIMHDGYFGPLLLSVGHGLIGVKRDAHLRMLPIRL